MVTAIFWAWGLSALVIVALAAVLGWAVRPVGGPLGIFIDHRGRFSLTHFQLICWSIVILSLISGVFWGRLVNDVEQPLSFGIPDEVLGLLGITIGSSVATTVAKTAKDSMAAPRIAASSAADRPRLAQIFFLEEGQYADQVVDVTKFQNFVITLVLLVAYVALAIDTIQDAESARNVTALPGFSGTFLTLLGISHAAYVAGKLPNQSGAAPGLTIGNRAGIDPTTMPPGVGPRNPP
jgi:hypothetical protein